MISKKAAAPTATAPAATPAAAPKAPASAPMATAPAPSAPIKAATQPAAGGQSFPLLRANAAVLNQLKIVSRDNPQALAQYIQQLKNTHPQIIEEINKNRPGFLQLMREPITETPPAVQGGAEGMYEDD